jgi:hypothetical protein
MLINVNAVGVRRIGSTPPLIKPMYIACHVACRIACQASKILSQFILLNGRAPFCGVQGSSVVTKCLDDLLHLVDGRVLVVQV